MSLKLQSKLLKNALFFNATTKLLTQQDQFCQAYKIDKTNAAEYDALTRLISIPLAPIGFLLTCVEKLALFVYHGVWSLLQLLTCHGNDSKAQASLSMQCLAEGLVALIAAPLSLVLNPIDLLVGGIKTIGEFSNTKSNASIHFNFG